MKKLLLMSTITLYSLSSYGQQATSLVQQHFGFSDEMLAKNYVMETLSEATFNSEQEELDAIKAALEFFDANKESILFDVKRLELDDLSQIVSEIKVSKLSKLASIGSMIANSAASLGGEIKSTNSLKKQQQLDAAADRKARNMERLMNNSHR